MIQSLRRTHRWAFFGLSLALPAVFAGGLLSRKPPAPAHSAVPWRAPNEENTTRSGEMRRVFKDGVIVVSKTEENLSVRVEPETQQVGPDVLVFWSASAARDGGLPQGASLLGVLDEPSGQWPLPNEARQIRGRLSLYSLAHREVLVSIPLE